MIIFLYGADSFRSHRMLDDMKKKFIRDVDNDAGSLSRLDGRAAGLEDIVEKINTGSLFVKKRLVIIDDIFQNKKEKLFGELAAYLKKLPAGEDDIIIFIDGEITGKDKAMKASAKELFAFLSRQKYAQEFKLLSDIQLLNFIKKEAAIYGKEMSAAAASRLISLAGGDLWIIAGEVKKLSFYSTAKMISDSAVEDLCQGTVNDNIFALTDALGAKNKALAFKLLEEQYAAGLSDEYLIAMLVRQFKILLQIRDAIDDGSRPDKIAGNLKLHPYVVKKSLLQIKNFSADALKNSLDRLIRLDFLNKSGSSQTKTGLMLLVADL